MLLKNRLCYFIIILLFCFGLLLSPMSINAQQGMGTFIPWSDGVEENFHFDNGIALYSDNDNSCYKEVEFPEGTFDFMSNKSIGEFVFVNTYSPYKFQEYYNGQVHVGNLPDGALLSDISLKFTPVNDVDDEYVFIYKNGKGKEVLQFIIPESLNSDPDNHGFPTIDQIGSNVNNRMSYFDSMYLDLDESSFNRNFMINSETGNEMMHFPLIVVERTNDIFKDNIISTIMVNNHQVAPDWEKVKNEGKLNGVNFIKIFADIRYSKNYEVTFADFEINTKTTLTYDTILKQLATNVDNLNTDGLIIQTEPEYGYDSNDWFGGGVVITKPAQPISKDSGFSSNQPGEYLLSVIINDDRVSEGNIQKIKVTVLAANDGDSNYIKVDPHYRVSHIYDSTVSCPVPINQVILSNIKDSTPPPSISIPQLSVEPTPPTPTPKEPKEIHKQLPKTGESINLLPILTIGLSLVFGFMRYKNK